MVNWSRKLQYTRVQALRVSSAQPVTAPHREINTTAAFTLEKTLPPAQLNQKWGEKEAMMLAGLKKLVFFGAAAGTELRTQGHSRVATYESQWQS